MEVKTKMDMVMGMKCSGMRWNGLEWKGVERVEWKQIPGD